jgi:hypothetical protein
MQFYLQYVLGMENPSGKAASLGCCTHKALECIAQLNICKKQKLEFFDDENLGRILVNEAPEKIMEKSFKWHRENVEHDNWDDKKDLRDCQRWLSVVLKDPIYSPTKRNILDIEKFFDFEIKKPWAKYKYDLPNGQKLEGNLVLKGSIDLVTEVRPGIIEVIDWKTGASRKDFATGKEKDLASLHDDPQLRMYHYAAHNVYDAKEIIITIYYVRAGGPFTLMLSQKDLKDTEEIIRNKFEHIKRTTKPKLDPGPPWSDNPKPEIASFKCFKLCKFSRPSKENPGVSTCEFIKNEIQKVGIENVTTKYGDLSKINKYGEGGGRNSSD